MPPHPSEEIIDLLDDCRRGRGSEERVAALMTHGLEPELLQILRGLRQYVADAEIRRRDPAYESYWVDQLAKDRRRLVRALERYEAPFAVELIDRALRGDDPASDEIVAHSSRHLDSLKGILHLLQHHVADADIRRKDPAYQASQIEKLRELREQALALTALEPHVPGPPERRSTRLRRGFRLVAAALGLWLLLTCQGRCRDFIASDRLSRRRRRVARGPPDVRGSAGSVIARARPPRSRTQSDMPTALRAAGPSERFAGPRSGTATGGRPIDFPPSAPPRRRRPQRCGRWKSWNSPVSLIPSPASLISQRLVA